MANQDIKPVSSSTGAFLALNLPDEKSAGGKFQPDAGKTVPQKPESRPDMERLARQQNIVSQTIGRDLRFQVNMKTGKSVIQVLDRETGEIVRQIPPEQARTYMSEAGAVTLRLFDDLI